ncbi:hypothetical protein ACJX0J_013861, partial [Zea mays]
GNTLILEKCQTLDELKCAYIYNNQSGSVKHEIILCHSQMKLKLVVLGQSGVGDRLFSTFLFATENERAYAQLQSLMQKLDAQFFTDGPDIWTDNYINALITSWAKRPDS